MMERTKTMNNAMQTEIQLAKIRDFLTPIPLHQRQPRKHLSHLHELSEFVDRQIDREFAGAPNVAVPAQVGPEKYEGGHPHPHQQRQNNGAVNYLPFQNPAKTACSQQ
jgi:hypothetical protein